MFSATELRMLNQQYPVLSSVATSIQPYLARVLQTKRFGSCYGPIKVDSLSSSCNSNYDCFRLLIPYAREHLAWSVMFDSCNPELGPDLTFNDLNFLMDPDADNLSSQVPSFFKWNLQDTDALLNMLQEFLLCYKDYQIELLAKQGDRLQLEYSTLVCETEISKKDIDVLMLPLGVAKPTEARFVINISMDCSRLPPRFQMSQNDEAMLIITFYGPDWNRIVPQLHLSRTLEDGFGGPDALHIPPIPPNKYLMDYVPEVKKYIEEKINNVAQCYESRAEFVSIIQRFQHGSIIEYDAIEFHWMTLLLEYRDFHFLMSITLLPTFPKEKPQITLQSIYHMTSGILYREVLDDVPYNPKWPMKQIVEKILTHTVEIAGKKFQANSVRNNRL